jgi:hypothetical protein
LKGIQNPSNSDLFNAIAYCKAVSLSKFVEPKDSLVAEGDWSSNSGFVFLHKSVRFFLFEGLGHSSAKIFGLSLTN